MVNPTGRARASAPVELFGHGRTPATWPFRPIPVTGGGVCGFIRTRSLSRIDLCPSRALGRSEVRVWTKMAAAAHCQHGATATTPDSDEEKGREGDQLTEECDGELGEARGCRSATSGAAVAGVRGEGRGS